MIKIFSKTSLLRGIVWYNSWEIFCFFFWYLSFILLCTIVNLLTLWWKSGFPRCWRNGQFWHHNQVIGFTTRLPSKLGILVRLGQYEQFRYVIYGHSSGILFIFGHLEQFKYPRLDKLGIWRRLGHLSQFKYIRLGKISSGNGNSSTRWDWVDPRFASNWGNIYNISLSDWGRKISLLNNKDKNNSTFLNWASSGETI